MAASATVLTTSPGFATPEPLRERLRRDGLELLRHTSDDQALFDLAAKADFLVAGLPPVTARTLDAAPRLRAVLKHGAGLDSIDIDACSARGLPVLSTPGANARAVAEMALAGILALSRNLVTGHASVTSGEWNRMPGREIGGRTLGILGFGRIGQQLGQMAQALGMTVIAYDPWIAPRVAADMGVKTGTLDEVLTAADYLSIHASAGVDTSGLVSGARMDRMKPGSVILNYARGPIIDLDALDARLRSGHLGGAALDVYATEPPDRAHPIFRNPYVLFSPHSGADTAEALLRMGAMVLDDIETLRRGELPARTVNRDALERQG